MSQLELQLGPMFVELVWITGGIDLLFAWELRCFLGENSFWPGWMRCGVGQGKGGGAGKQSGMESTHGRTGTLLLSRSEGERN